MAVTLGVPVLHYILHYFVHNITTLHFAALQQTPHYTIFHYYAQTTLRRAKLNHGRMVARHQHHTRAAAGVSRGFGNLIVSTSINHDATSYNNFLVETHNMKEFKHSLKDWIKKNINL